MIVKLDLNNKQTLSHIIELQKKSYIVEAKIIDFYDIPPLKDTIESLEICDEVFYGYMKEDILVGLISYKVTSNILDIHRIAIHPLYFRKGIATKLINFVYKLEHNIDKVVVCTGKDNIPAVNLYLSNGYIKKADIEVSKNIYITQFEKLLREN